MLKDKILVLMDTALIKKYYINIKLQPSVLLIIFNNLNIEIKNIQIQPTLNDCYKKVYGCWPPIFDGLGMIGMFWF